MQGRQQSTRQHAHREATGATRLLLKTSRTFRDNVKKTNRTARKLARLTKAIEVILVPLIKANALDELKFLLKKMDADQVRELGRSRIMGLCRLFFAHDEPTAASQVLLTYLARDDPYDLLYFIEPLCELIRRNCSGLEEIELRIGAKRNDVIGWLANAYLPADESDLKNFLDFVIEPLRLVERGNGNLMQIRLSESQRHKFTTTIASRLEQRKPFSLVRLGDGEAYPYAPPPAEGIDPGIFNEDSKNFERRTWGRSPPPGASAEEYKACFREAIAKADVIGIPSVYRIIRNLTAPYTRYGNRKYQRAFMRILHALGSEIPLEETLFTEERCSRISGALDENLLIDLAGRAKSVVLVTCFDKLADKFKAYSPVSILVPQDISQLIQEYQLVADRVRSLSGPGSLVIIGAGQIGKILAHEARQVGSVALDVGSLLDYMMGLKTRTIADLV